MQVNEFPLCCGAGTITHLDFLGTGEITLHALKKNVKRAKLEHWGIIIGITNTHQQQTADLMQKFGFVNVKTFNNPVHGSTLQLWVLDLNNIDYEDLEDSSKNSEKQPVLEKPRSIAEDLYDDWNWHFDNRC